MIMNDGTNGSGSSSSGGDPPLSPTMDIDARLPKSEGGKRKAEPESVTSPPPLVDSVNLGGGSTNMDTSTNKRKSYNHDTLTDKEERKIQRFISLHLSKK